MLIFDANCHSFENGAALFEISTRINHSCQPSAIWHEENGTIYHEAKRSIRAGEEITIRYQAQLEEWTREERIKHLQDSRYFWCRCNLCESGDSDSECEPNKH